MNNDKNEYSTEDIENIQTDNFNLFTVTSNESTNLN